MPRPRKAAAEVPSVVLPQSPNDNGVELADLPVSSAAMSAREERAERDIDDVLLELGGDTVVKVARVSEAGQRQHVGQLPGEEFSLDLLADTFGGGRYWLRVMLGKQEQWRGYVEIDPTIPPKNPRAGKPAAVAAPGTPDLTGVLTTMMAAQQNQVTMMQTVMTGMMSGMAALMESMAAARPERENPLETVKAVVELVRPNVGTGESAAAEALKMLREGIQLGREVSGEGDGDSIGSLVNIGVKGLAHIVQGAQPPAPPAPPVVVQSIPIPARVETAAAPPVMPNVQPEVRRVEQGEPARPWIQEARQFEGQLRTMATLGVEPDAVVEIVTKGASEEMWNDLQAFYDEAPATFEERAAQAFPILASLGEWGRKFVHDLAYSLSPEEGDDAAQHRDGTP